MRSKELYMKKNNFLGLVMDYLIVSFRMFLAFVLVLLFFHISGNKRQFTQMTSFDLISNFVLSSIFGGYIFNPDLTWEGFVYIVTIYFVINWIINYLAKNTSWGRGVVIGTPTIIINDGQIVPKNLQKMNMNMIDFMSLLRTKDVHSLAEVKLAQIEVGGDLTVVLKGDENFSLALIENGHLNEENLKRSKKTKKWLNEQLKKRKLKIGDVFFAEWFENDLYIVKFK